MTGLIDPQRAVTHRLRIGSLKIGAQNLNLASPFTTVLTGLLFLSEKASKEVLLLLLLLFAWF